MSRYFTKPKRGIYRSRNGVIFGVCRGLAEHFDFSVFWARAIAVAFLIFTGFWPAIGLYIIGALLMKSEPAPASQSRSTQGSYTCRSGSKEGPGERLKRRFKNLEKRIHRMEDVVTSKEYDWEKRSAKS
jgi:phage shock protein C